MQYLNLLISEKLAEYKAIAQTHIKEVIYLSQNGMWFNNPI